MFLTVIWNEKIVFQIKQKFIPIRNKGLKI